MKLQIRPIFSVVFVIILLPALLCTAQENEEIRFAPPLKQIWQMQVESLEITSNQVSLFSTPIFDARRVYFASTNGVLYCLFKGTWQTSWTFHSSAPITLDLALIGETICFTDGNSVYALDSRTGVPRWVHNAPSAVTAGLEANKKPVSAGLEAFEDAVYYADILGSVRCLSVKTGELLWEHKPAIEEGDVQSASVRSGLHVDDQYFIFGDDRGQLAALRLTTGERVWSFKAGDAIQSGILRHGNRIFFGSNDNHVYCVEAGSGKLNWKQRTAGDVRGVPVADDQYVYISSRDRSLRVINMFNGYPARVGPIALPVNFDFSPLLVDNRLYIPQGSVISPRITEGTFRPEATYANSAGDITTSLIYDAEEKFLYFGTRSGKFVVVAPAALKFDEFIVSPDVAADIELPAADPSAGEETSRREQRRNRQRDNDPPSEQTEEQQTSQQGQEKLPTETAPAEQPEVQKETTKAGPEKSSPEEAVQPSPDEPKGEEKSADPAGTLTEQLQLGRDALKNGNLERASSIFSETLRPDREKWYTINLGLYCQQDTMNALIESLKNEEIMVFQRQLEEQTCYFICLSLYESREKAEFAIEDMDLSARFEADISALRLDSFIPES